MPSFASSLHWPRQHSFVARRHDRSLDQFRMVGHHPENFVVAQVSSSHKLSVGLFVRSQPILWSQPSASKQLFKRIDGERLRKIVDGLVATPFAVKILLTSRHLF